MSNLREAVGLAVQSHNLGMAEWSERAIDRVAALGAAGRVSALGEQVFRWMYGGDPRSAVEAATIVAALLHQFDLSFDERLRLAQYAMDEFAGAARCWQCNGIGSVKLADGELRVCAACIGTGLVPVKNWQRAQGLGVERGEYRRRYHRPLEEALDKLREADREVNREVARQLDRGGGQQNLRKSSIRG